MTALEAQKIVLKSIAQEVNANFFEIHERLENGLILSQDAKELSRKVGELESVMGYIRCEMSLANRATVNEISRELDSILRGEV